jgi:hypothetical protein
METLYTDSLFPRNQAEYITAAALKRIPPEEFNPAPDTSYRPDLEEETAAPVALNLLKAPLPLDT